MSNPSNPAQDWADKVAEWVEPCPRCVAYEVDGEAGIQMCRYHQGCSDALEWAWDEVERLRDGFHTVSGWLVAEADDGRQVDPDTVLMMLGAWLDGEDGYEPGHGPECCTPTARQGRE